MKSPEAPALDISAIRRRLAESDGRRFWSSLEEIIDEAAVRHWLEAEFPAAAAALTAPARRDVLKLMGASLLLAGLAGCGETRSDLALPYVTQPDEITPGVPRYYATAVLFEGFAQPVLATTHVGRPTKLDGNPDHPVTRGASDPFMQAAVWQLYDPDRSKAPLRDGLTSTWAAFERELTDLRSQWKRTAGQGLRILTGDITSPTAIRQLQQLQSEFPGMRLHVFEPVGRQRTPEALRLVFGREADQHYSLDRCDVIASLEDDILGPGPHQVIHARQWAQRRGETDPHERRVQLHVAESTPTLSGAVATTRLSVNASRIYDLAAAIAAQIGASPAQGPQLDESERRWVGHVSEELRAHAGRSLLAMGAHLPPAVQAIGIEINQRLGNIGKTLWHSEPVSLRSDPSHSLRELARDIEAGRVDALIVLGANPAYAADAALNFKDLIARVQHRIHIGLYADETAALCRWHLPLAHALESWGDARAVDGTITILQPLVAPLYRVRTLHQLLDMTLGAIDPAADEAVRATWAERFGQEFDLRWRRSLHDGFVEGSAAAPLALAPTSVDFPAPPARADGAVEIVFRPDPTVWDGRLANVAWLQELPKPLTKVTWENVIAVSPRIAERLQLSNGDRVEIEIAGRRVMGPAWVMPGQASNTVTLYLGYGQNALGTIGRGLGYSAYQVKQGDADAWFATGAIRKAQGVHPLASTQSHYRMDGFDFVREVTPHNPTIEQSRQDATLYPEWDRSGIAWGMVIDLDLCIGCNACITACDAENNVLAVGKDQVAMGREMHWLRVDRYYTGPLENPRSFFQPVPCMHCEKAPCEMGCPVHATAHNHEGLNQMVYNRCIGTRTCSSYCPYKVRRFNWFDYRAPEASPIHAAENPDVTVRSRGVMEKCTYCTQRIEAAHVAADKEKRAIREGEVRTACQQACPTTAIAFGNLNDPNSAAAKRRKSGRNYALLERLGTRPRTTYLARWNDEPEGEDS